MRLTATGRAVRHVWGSRVAYNCRRNVTCSPRRSQVAAQVKPDTSSQASRSELKVGSRSFDVDEWTNTPSSILSFLPRRLHVQHSHPISITRQIIEQNFSWPKFTHYHNFDPIVSVFENFDSLGFPADHPGRNRSDTYYLNKDTVLRTHTSAHEAEVFRTCPSEGYTISADVYRRDAIDRSHYPVFHQMEGARMWDRKQVPRGNIKEAVWSDLKQLPKYDLAVEDPNPTVHHKRNPLQKAFHGIEEVEAIAAHLKRSLEGVVFELFLRAKSAAEAAGMSPQDDEPLKVRWVEAYFPFTSPSWELEVFWHGDWLEVLGCGITKQELYINAGVPQKLGWAFGIGLERVAMILFGIPDIRLFWSQDPRFLSQFSDADSITRFSPFSKYPASAKDVSFWLHSSSSSAGGGLKSNAQDFHENDVMEVVRETGGDLVEDVQKVDEFTHPTSGRKSLCYRITYRSLEKTFRTEEVLEIHERVRKRLVEDLGVELR